MKLAVEPAAASVRTVALTGSTPPGAVIGESADISSLRWILYFAGWVFLFSSVMHTFFAQKIAESIGWKTNGFQ